MIEKIVQTAKHKVKAIVLTVKTLVACAGVAGEGTPPGMPFPAMVPVVIDAPLQPSRGWY
jgi:hypothetical protein